MRQNQLQGGFFSLLAEKIIKALVPHLGSLAKVLAPSLVFNQATLKCCKAYIFWILGAFMVFSMVYLVFKVLLGIIRLLVAIVRGIWFLFFST